MNAIQLESLYITNEEFSLPFRLRSIMNMSIMFVRYALILGSLLGFCGPTRGKFEWQNSQLWSSCSKACGIGVQENLLACVQKTLIGTYEKVSYDKCRRIRKPREKTMKTCFLGVCPTNETSEFIWKVGEWTSCSTSCGGEGVRTRDVQCILSLYSGGYMNAKHYDCKSEYEPVKNEKCGYFDCPPEFFTTSWLKCTKMRNCQSPGIRRRQINCMVTTKNGTSKSVPKGNCYIRSKPPATWESCFKDPEYQSKCQFKDKKKKRKPPIISISKLKIHHMRSSKKLKLNVGQTAFVLPHTRIEIKCPVINFPSENLQWLKDNITYAFIRRAKERIHVSRKGYLIIKKFSPKDEGKWICKAGTITAEIEILTQNPSDGFSHYLSRIIYFKEDIVEGKNNSAIKYIKPLFYQWVVGPWSICSKSCGIGGYQTRYVGCELIERRYFIEVDGGKCLKKNSMKPDNIRECVLFQKCPTWWIGEPYSHKCTETCLDVGKSLKDLKLKCKYENKVLLPNNCDLSTQPIETCHNPNCTLFWKTEKWSTCSSSCGNPGIKARTVSCRWRNDNSQAGSLCSKAKIRMPLLIKKCSAPPCNLGCMDLSKHCGLRKLCSVDHYQHFCCKTCNYK